MEVNKIALSIEQPIFLITIHDELMHLFLFMMTLTIEIILNSE